MKNHLQINIFMLASFLLASFDANKSFQLLFMNRWSAHREIARKIIQTVAEDDGSSANSASYVDVHAPRVSRDDNFTSLALWGEHGKLLKNRSVHKQSVVSYRSGPTYVQLQPEIRVIKWHRNGEKWATAAKNLLFIRLCESSLFLHFTMCKTLSRCRRDVMPASVWIITRNMWMNKWVRAPYSARCHKIQNRWCSAEQSRCNYQPRKFILMPAN